MIATRSPAVVRASARAAGRLSKHRHVTGARPLSVCVRAFQGDAAQNPQQEPSAVAPASSQQPAPPAPAAPRLMVRSAMRLPSLMHEMEKELDSMTRMMGLPSLGSFWGEDDFFAAPQRLLRDLAPPSALPALPKLHLATDITETDTAYLIKADAPGMAKSDIKVTVLDNVLTISGERREEHTFGGGQEEPAADAPATEEEQGAGKEVAKRPAAAAAPLRYERSYGAFRRSFSLPPNVDVDGITATAQDGVLTVTLPKAPEAAPQAKEVPVA